MHRNGPNLDSVDGERWWLCLATGCKQRHSRFELL